MQGIIGEILGLEKVHPSNKETDNTQSLAPASKFGCIMIATSDKGMCGQIHSSVFKKLASIIDKDPAYSKLPLITIGDKISALAKKYFLYWSFYKK